MTEFADRQWGPRLFRAGDLPGLMRLKESASWNQTADDFHRMLAIEPEGCFAIECEGTLAACTTAVRYGKELAWIGMVLTLPEFRGRGLARRLVEHALEYCRAGGVRWTKLDATDMGAPLYRKLGFEPECAIERWLRPAGPAPAPARAVKSGAPDLALDCRAFGADRSALLSALAAEGGVSVAGGGYAMGRAGSKARYFGPCVSPSPEAVRELLAAFLAAHPGEPVFWDLLPENEAAAALATEFGFAPVRKLLRMSRREDAGAAPVAADNSLVYAAAGFEFG
ncbi:MAG: GNAT family N-acetyltransferase [Acidobacteriota bacterium]